MFYDSRVDVFTATDLALGLTSFFPSFRKINQISSFPAQLHLRSVEAEAKLSTSWPKHVALPRFFSLP